jgi:phenylpropionate dioxygenase-like ring-hydroxylating dioxygenase large terminal subunit
LVELGKKEFHATSYETKEEYGLVWMKPHPEPVLYPRLEIPQYSDQRYTTLVREVSLDAGVHSVCENALDVPHTSILHRGLFRGGKRNLIRAYARRNQNMAEIDYRGEPPPSGLVAWLLSIRGGEGTVTHFDRFFLPGVVQVEYQLGERTHFCITAFCSPCSDAQTKLFAVASFRTPLPGRLLSMALEPIAMRVFRQDAAILRAQSALIAEGGGPQFVSTEVDAMGPMIWRLLRTAARHEEAAEAQPISAGDWKSHEFSLWA